MAKAVRYHVQSRGGTYYVVRTNDDGTEERLATSHGSEFVAGCRAESLNRMVRRRVRELEAKRRTEGWGNLDNVRDAHYFRDGRSLCKRCGAFGSPRWERNQELGSEPTRGSGTCKACWTKRAAEEADAVLAIRTHTEKP